MKQQAAAGRTVFVSSHLMNEMAVTADHLIVIGRGRLLADCPTQEFIERHSAHEVLVRTPDAAALAGLVAAEGGEVTRDGDDTLVVTRMTAPRIAELAARARLVVYELTPRRGSLEAAFLDLTADSLEYGDHGQATPNGSAAHPARAGTAGRSGS